MMRNSLFAVACLVLGRAAASSATVACKHLQAVLGTSQVVLPSDAAYQNLSTENWSATTWKRPTCIVLPRSSTDVQKAVGVLTKEDVTFAIRSGGHSAAPNAANIDNGVLIAMDNLAQVSYDATLKAAKVGPGARWGAVYEKLDPYNLTVVGGRASDVGVGGLILGGGLSHLSELYGLACDNVLNFEVVLANGTIVNASHTSHSDLFWALKGGSSNFGIVTQYTLATYPIKDIWGGAQYFSLNQTSDVLAALEAYQTAPNKDPYANIVLDVVPTNETVAIVLTLVYLKPVVRPAAFAPFFKVTPLGDTTSLQTFYQLVANFPFVPIPRWNFYTATFQPNVNLYAQLSKLLNEAKGVRQLESLTAGTLLVAFEPVSPNSVIQGNARGGNALGLQPVAQTWLGLNVGWWSASDDDAANAAAGSVIDQVSSQAKKEGALLDFIFVNDASPTQAAIASYGAANVQRLRRVQQLYDPCHVFQKLVYGGQKLPTN